MDNQTILLSVFGMLVVVSLLLDLGLFNRGAKKVTMKAATLQSVFWILLSLSFAVLIQVIYGKEQTVGFLSAYLTEKLLSIDNLFVILLIFDFFKLEEKYHHRVLFWGVLGAILLRALFIGLGSVIIEQFHWVLYIFGGILLYTGIKLFWEKKESHVNFHDNFALKLAKRYLPFTNSEHNGKFFVKENGKFLATTLFLVVLLVEATDLIFAVDSIPAVFAISQNTLIVFTSNIFAVLGLRALFFVIEGVVHRFHHLQKGLAFILCFIGVKMLLGIFHIHLDSILSFVVILLALGTALLASVVFPKKI